MANCVLLLVMVRTAIDLFPVFRSPSRRCSPNAIKPHDMRRGGRQKQVALDEAGGASSFLAIVAFLVKILVFNVVANNPNRNGVHAFLPRHSLDHRRSQFENTRAVLATRQDREEETVQMAQEALQSARGAREIRKFRSSRGRARTFLVSAPPRKAAQPKKNSMSAHGSMNTSSLSSSLHEMSAFSSAVCVDLQRNATDPALDTSGAARLSCVNTIDLSFNVTMKALQAFHQQHGHLVLPRRFVVPVDAATYPDEWRGLDLSSTVYTMKWWLRHVKQRPERVKQLNSLGFVWERLQPEWNLILEALIVYLQHHGHTRVPFNFVVPHGDLDGQWPRSTWGLPLGSCVYRIRSRHDFLRGPSSLSRRQQLDRIGFVWDVSEEAFQRFYEALQHYARLHRMGPYSSPSHKALRVPSLFVVPANDSSWPKSLWGYPLGERSSAVRSKQLYVKRCSRRQKLLQDLGFRFNSDLSWFRVVHAAAIYSQLHGRILTVPCHFVVPCPSTPEEQDGWPWPEYLWGLRLGQRLKDVRVKGAYLQGPMGVSRRRQLDALGMDWAPKRGRVRNTMDTR
jgi:Helicase associated domain